MTIHIYHDWSGKWQLHCIVIVNVRFNTHTRSNICEYLLLRVLDPNKRFLCIYRTLSTYAYSIQTIWLYIYIRFQRLLKTTVTNLTYAYFHLSTRLVYTNIHHHMYLHYQTYFYRDRFIWENMLP